MLERDAVWSLVGIGAGCWAVGGGGQQWARRYLWPVVLAFTAMLCGVSYWRALLGLSTVSGSLHLGYGERTGRARRVGVFSLYGFSLLPFGVPLWWGLLMAATLWTLWSLSRRLNWFTWKWWELTAGALQGAAVASSLLS